MQYNLEIVIIGGGASGTLAAIHLLQWLKVKAHILLIEKSKAATFRGVAYSSPLHYEPLNVPAGKMSAFEDQPDHFYNWLVENKANANHKISKTDFVSRRWFGDYLTDTVNTLSQQKSNIDFKILNDEAIDIVGHNSARYSILLDDGSIITTNVIIFATGNEAPTSIFSQNETQQLNGNYHGVNWNYQSVKTIPADADVLILGTGLTMVDHAVSLYHQKHAGKIYAFSRNGYLPLTHLKEDEETELEEYSAGNSNGKQSLHEVFTEVRQNLADGNANNISWQNVVDGLRNKTSNWWQHFDEDSKKIFLKRLRTFWEIHRHRMPQASANALEAMKNARQFELISGKSKGIEKINNRLVFGYQAKQTTQQKHITVDHVINCTGPVSDYTQSQNQLVQNLLGKGLMVQDALKLGIVTGKDGAIISSNQNVLPNTYSLGALRKAAEWETTAIREIRSQAQSIAKAISTTYL